MAKLDSACHWRRSPTAPDVAGEPDGTWHAPMNRWEPEAEDFAWERHAPTMAECVETFVRAPLFGGLAFWQAEGEMAPLYA